jgi:hypothetical protein
MALVLANGAQAQTPPTGGTPPAADQTPALQALQAAIDAKDSQAIFSILNQTPRDQRGPLATLLLSAAQGLQATDKQFAATLAAMAFISGGLTPIQQNTAVAIVRDAPAGLAIVNTMLAANLTGGFGFTAVTTVGLFNLIITENQNQVQSSPN